jgi:D-3-phosphoglycerate dehydrogenase
MKVVVTDRRFSDRDPYTDPVRAAGEELVYANCQSQQDVVEACRDATVVVAFKAPITREVIENMENARLIVRNGTGYDNVDVTAATEHGIPVSNIPNYCTEEVASHAITLMLAVAHEVVRADHDLRTADGWGERPMNRPLYDGTFGVVGLGRIGRSAARKAEGYGMDVIAHDPYQHEDIFAEVGVERVEFDELLDRADCVSVHTPLTGETHHMLSKAEFMRMKDDAVVVNTARGPIVDEQALLEAVEAGELWGAGLDVFETEPPKNSPSFKSERIVVSPHHAGMSERAEQRCIDIGVEKIVAALEGEPLGAILNPEAYGDADRYSPERDYWDADESADFST